MSQPMRLTSVSNPRVKAVVRLREARGAGGRRRTGLFIAEGRREVGRALAAGLAVREVYVCPPLLGDDSAFELGELRSDRIVEVSEPVLRKMANLAEPEGVLAVVAQPQWTLEGLGEVTDQTLLLVAVGTQKPGNLGAMVRTAEAAGCQGVLATDAVDAFGPQAIRNSTCAVFSMPTVTVEEAEALRWLRSRGVRVVASTPAGAVEHVEADLTGPLALVIGPEDAGLSETWLAAADERVAIAMHGRLVDSLNASNAAAVLLFEALRQRGQTGPANG